MNNHPADSPSTFPTRKQLQVPLEQKVVSTVVLLLLGYYVLNHFDVWPSAIKRTVYELFVYIVPSPAIYAIEAAMVRLGRTTPHTGPRFKRTDFGNQQAKAEALARLYGQAPIPIALRKARSLSGIDSLIPSNGPLDFAGLGNWDNSCYQNSVLQALASLPAFNEYIERSLESCRRSRTPAATHAALSNFLIELNEEACSRTTLWTPRVLKSMDSWQQQDAQEYYSRIIDALEKESTRYTRAVMKRACPDLACLRRSHSPEAEDHIASLQHRETSCSNLTAPCKHTRKLQKLLNNGALANPLDGMLAQGLVCQFCGFSEGLSLTQFNCLTLNMGLRGHSDLEELLEEYTEPETVDGVECTKCTDVAYKAAHPEGDAYVASTKSGTTFSRSKKEPVLRTKAKQITIGRLPQDLVVHINRSIFDDVGNQRKNSSSVYFPAHLKFLNRWCAPLDDEDDSAVQGHYRLKCAVVHYGSHENGHYIALGQRGKEGRWYCFNDEIVTEVTLEEVTGHRNAFMLFYERFDPSTEPIPPTSTHQEILPMQETRQALSRSVSTTSSDDEVFADAGNQRVQQRIPMPVLRTSSGSVDQSPFLLPSVVSAL